MTTIIVLSHGLDSVLAHVFRAVQDSGDFRVIVAGPEGCSGDSGLEEAHMEAIRSKMDFRAMRSLRRIIRKFHAGLVFAPSTSGLSVALRAKIFTGARVVGYRGTQAKVRPLDPTYYIALLHPGVSAMICETADIRDYLSRFIPAHKLSAMPKPFMEEWVAPDKANPCFPPEPGVFNISYVGVSAGRPHKGLQHLVEAIKTINRDHPELVDKIRLTVVGKADNQLMNASPTNVTYLGNRSDAVRFIAGSHLFVLSSTRDASPRVVREAQACGVPCIVSDIPGARDLIVSSGSRQSGVLVPPANSRALADAILALMNNPAERARMSENAVENIRKNFNMAAYVRFMADILNTTAKR